MKKLFLNTDGSIRQGWWVVIFFIVLTVLLLPVVFIAKQYSLPVSILIQIVVVLAASVICQWMAGLGLKDLIGPINREWFEDLLKGLCYGAVLMIVPALLLTETGNISWSVNEFSFQVLSNGLVTFLQVAIIEELLFRGFIFQRLIVASGKRIAQIIVGGLFLLTHLENPGMTGTVSIVAGINIFLASVLFGLAYITTKKLAMPLGLHFMANYMQGTILGFGVSGHDQS